MTRLLALAVLVLASHSARSQTDFEVPQGCRPVPRSPLNGRVSWRVTQGVVVATYTCALGFQMSGGDRVRMCAVNGYSGREPRCVASGIVPPRETVLPPGSCEEPVAPSNGRVSWRGVGNQVTATYSCSPGFSLTASATRTCDGGVWSPVEPPFCRSDIQDAPACAVPVVPDNGNVVYRLDGNRPVSAQYRCYRADCTLTGPVTRNCVDGKWQPDQVPVCTCPPVFTNPDRTLPEPKDIVVRLPAGTTFSSYTVRVYYFNQAGQWEEVHSRQNLRASNFPYPVPSLPEGFYMVRVDGSSGGGQSFQTLTTLQEGTPPANVFVPVFRVSGGAGGSSVTVHFPTTTSQFRSRYGVWELQYRVGSGQWRTYRYPVGTDRTDITGLGPGSYSFRLRAAGAGGQPVTPYSVVGVFDNAVNEPPSEQPADACRPNPCRNDAECFSGALIALPGVRFYCLCVGSYTGQLCENPLVPEVTTPPTTAPPVRDPCAFSPCRNGGTCFPSGRTYACACMRGYEGDTCERFMNPCDSVRCSSGSNCIRDMTVSAGYRCEAPARPCDSNLCRNLATCVPNSRRSIGYDCFCRPGTTGQFCQDPVVNPCSSAPCANGGRCSRTSSGYSCACVGQYTGRNCQIEPNRCANHQCRNGATCSANRLRSIGYDCSCSQGYRGQFCSEPDVNPCSSAPCANGGRCSRTSSGYSCACVGQYTGRNCQIEPNRCANHQCRNGATCSANRLRSIGYDCSCSPAYSGQFCSEPVAPQQSDVTISPTSSLRLMATDFRTLRCAYTGNYQVQETRWSRADGRPLGSGVLQQRSEILFFFAPATAAGSYVCTVRHSGGTSRATATVIHTGASAGPCDNHRCQGAATCAPNPLRSIGYTCLCTSGYRGQFCDEPIRNPCSPSPCANGGRCSARSGSYNCDCAGGFTGRNCENVIETNPCASSPCLNGGACRKTAFGYSCSCVAGYTGTNCQTRPQITPPSVPGGPLTVTVNPEQSIRQRTNSTALYCQATALPRGYTVTSTQWDRTNFAPLPVGRSQMYTRNTYLVVMDHRTEDSGTYRCTVEATNQIGQTVRSSATATITVTDVKIRIQPMSVAKKVGESVVLECVVEGVSEAPTWRRQNSSRNYPSGRYLNLPNLRPSDSDQYFCSVSSGLKATSTLTVVLSEGEGMCIADDGRTMEFGEFRYVNGTQTVREARISPAADFVFLVDESGSMRQEHAWLERISAGLDNALKLEGIGTSIPNQFCLIGFAHDPFTTGRVLPMPSGQVMGNAAEFDEARKALATDGRKEDLYAAMNVGLERCELRPGMACQVIGVTDEGRNQPPLVGDNLNSMLAKLQSRNCVLNVGVNEQMLSDTPSGAITALGVSSNNDSAIETFGGNFELVRGKGRAMAISGHGNTDAMYTQLAFKTGGAAWNLNELRKGGDTALAFTRAFIDLKVREISKQVCQLCECTGGPLPVCDQGCLGEPPGVSVTGPDTVPAGQDVELICIPTAGRPLPDLEYKPGAGESGLPPNSKAVVQGDSILLRVTNVREKFCVDCVGTNLEGEVVDTHCVTPLAERPEVDLTGSNDGQPVPHGSPVTLTCVPVRGLPSPTLEIVASSGYQIPRNARITRGDSNVVITIPNLTEDVCFDCVGRNSAGRHVDQECLRVQAVLPDVELTGSNNGNPVQLDEPVTLTCIPKAGIPDPTLTVSPSRGYRLPAGARVETSGRNVVVNIPNLRSDVCFDCVGQNSAGTDVDQLCLTIASEPPAVDLTGSNRGQPVNAGSSVTLVCTPTAGMPDPTLEVTPSSGYTLPPGATVRRSGRNVVVTLPQVNSNICFDCVGTNAAGRDVDQECIRVLEYCVNPNGGDIVYHGGTIRNYTSQEGPTQTTVPGSAVIIFVIDESGSMRQEHRWLEQLPTTMERNLVANNIGRVSPNQYALVGFGHAERNDPAREGGEVLQECGPAGDVQSTVRTLFQDGRLEDGYSAVATGLQSLSCIRNINTRRRQGARVACQVILVTDEGRDTLSPWNYDSMRALLGASECVLNVAIWEKFQGRRNAQEAYVPALGVAYNDQAVLPLPNDLYEIVPDGMPIDQTGAENTHNMYVKLAFATNGAAWDLGFLRSDLYRNSFTDGFIKVKVQEIIRQIIGQCLNCRCENGRWECSEIGGVIGEFSCLYPRTSGALSAVAAPRLLERRAGEQAEFTCMAVTAEIGGTATYWKNLTPRMLVLNNRMIITNVIPGVDDRTYECEASGPDGISTVSPVTLVVVGNVDEETSNGAQQPGPSVQLRCCAVSSFLTDDTLTWLKDGEVDRVHEGPVLSLQGADKQGTYYCLTTEPFRIGEVHVTYDPEQDRLVAAPGSQDHCEAEV